MRRDVRTLAAGVSAAVVALGWSAAPAAAKSTGGPDLSITRIAIKELPGTPPYITLDESSRAPGFVVKVSVQNNGRKESGKSVVALELKEKNTVKWSKDEFIDPMAPKKPRSKPRTVTFVVNNLKADLGFLTATATVKWALTKTRQRQDSDSAPPIPVIAREWNVGYFHARVNVGGIGPSSDTYGELTLTYRFSRFDEAQEEFVYNAYGQVTNQARYDAGGCSGSGSANATQNPWPGPAAESELLIKANLTQYSAGVVTSNQPPVVFNASCPALNNVSIPEQVPWEDLVTFTGSGPPSMTPDQTTLTDQGTKQSPVGEVKFLWNFVARLSGA